MLILTVKPHERVWLEIDGLEHPIQVVLSQVSPGRAKIGFVADEDHVKIYRDAIYSEVLQERIQALKTPQTETVQCLEPLPSVTSSPNA